MEHKPYVLQFKVRDYECDMAHVVNNSVYMNYLEHCRHEYLKTVGIDFSKLVKNKISLIITRAEVDYKWSLVSGDEFEVSAKIERVSKLHFAFNQKIHRLPDRKLVLEAKIIGTAIDSLGRPHMPEELDKISNQVTATTA